MRRFHIARALGVITHAEKRVVQKAHRNPALRFLKQKTADSMIGAIALVAIIEQRNFATR
ncbi:MAG: hypothetical protein ACX94A_07340 [Algiphilus sp.]